MISYHLLPRPTSWYQSETLERTLFSISIVDKFCHKRMHNIPQLAVFSKQKLVAFEVFGFTFTSGKMKSKSCFNYLSRLGRNYHLLFISKTFFFKYSPSILMGDIIHKVVKSSRFTRWLSDWNIYLNFIIISYNRNRQKLVCLAWLEEAEPIRKTGHEDSPSHIVFRLLKTFRVGQLHDRGFSLEWVIFKFCLWFVTVLTLNAPQWIWILCVSKIFLCWSYKTNMQKFINLYLQKTFSDWIGV